MVLEQSEEEAREGWLGSHRWQLKSWRDISVAERVPLRSVGSKPQAGLPSLQYHK